MRALVLVAVLLLAAPAWATLTIDWITVGDPGNGGETQTGGIGGGCYGAVTHTYKVSGHEITNTQYAESLTAVAATDANWLCTPYLEEWNRIPV